MEGLHPPQTQGNDLSFPPSLLSVAHAEQQAQQERQIMDVTARMQPPSKTSAAPKYKKAPDAPKRFKSAFIIFSAEKHREIKDDLTKQGRSEKTTDIAKLVSEAWRELAPDQKEVWEKKARKDKARYEVEKAMYKGPWKVPANKRTPKDPSAPKRPMSAFLAFSNKRRAALKRQHPDATNADLSKMLSKTWKEAPEELRRKYMDEEAELRQTYKVSMAKWRKKVAEEKKAERKEREAMAMQTAENRANEAARNANGGSMESMAHDMSGMGAPYYGFPPQPVQGDMNMNFGIPGGQQAQPGLGQGGGQQGHYLSGGFNPQMQQQQLLQQLLANQQMNPLMANGRGGMGMYGQPNGGQFGGPPVGGGNQFGGGMGSAGGNFGMDPPMPPPNQGNDGQEQSGMDHNHNNNNNHNNNAPNHGDHNENPNDNPDDSQHPRHHHHHGSSVSSASFDQQQNFAPPVFSRSNNENGDEAGVDPNDDYDEGTAI
ncbi:hypothetical protein ACA910_014249 [Epithemia clementina (nom. ined.)]